MNDGDGADKMAQVNSLETITSTGEEQMEHKRIRTSETKTNSDRQEDTHRGNRRSGDATLDTHSDSQA